MDNLQEVKQAQFADAVAEYNRELLNVTNAYARKIKYAEERAKVDVSGIEREEIPVEEIANFKSLLELLTPATPDATLSEQDKVNEPTSVAKFSIDDLKEFEAWSVKNALFMNGVVTYFTKFLEDRRLVQALLLVESHGFSITK